MAGLTELISSIGDENIEFQLLKNSMIRSKINTKHKDCEITFACGEDKASNHMEAIVVWVDKELFNSKLEKLIK